jgi:hypothetical protein
MTMIRSSMLLALTVLVGTSGCAYKGMYKQTNSSASSKPVAPDKVKVAKSKDAVDKAWVELGVYAGQAPTVKEAMEAAQRECGNHGANFYILNTEPFQSENVWKVDGICALAK